MGTMTDKRKELIERWAREAGFELDDGVIASNATSHSGYRPDHRDELERFAELVRADALEEAAKVCETMPPPYCRDLARGDCADAIRKLIQAP